MAKASYIWTGSEWLPVASAFPTAHQRFIKDSTATTYTLGVDDISKAIVFSNNSSITLTIPPESTYPFVNGQTFIVIQKGSGVVTVTAGSGVTLRSKSSYVKTAGQYSEIRLIKIGTNEWLLSGDLSS
jgi:hypothetical protein